MNDIRQFFPTANPIASLLIDQISLPAPEAVIDLGVGDGALIAAAQLRWPHARLLANDIDQSRLDSLGDYAPDIALLHGDALTDDIASLVSQVVARLDCGISNPPYSRIESTPERLALLERLGLPTEAARRCMSGAALFVARLLQLISPGGEVAVILPDTIITSRDFSGFRKALFTHHGVTAVIELPDKIFPKTEAKTHILALRSHGRTEEKVSLYAADRDGTLTGQIKLSPASLVNRMDFSFWSWKLGQNSRATKFVLGDLPVEIHRGRHSAKELRATALPFLHTSDLPARPGEIALPFAPGAGPCAHPGDIIIARVGTRCVGRRALITKGKCPYSDCVFVLRPQKEWRRRIWDALTSPFADEWLEAHAHGVCAKAVSKIDLLTFPIV